MGLQNFSHGVSRSVAKYSRRVHRASPFRMRQDLAKTRVVGSVIQQAFHPVDLGIHLVARFGQHREPRARIDVVGPVSRLSNLAAQFFSEFQKAVQQPILFGFDLVADGYQIVPSVLVGWDGQQLHGRGGSVSPHCAVSIGIVLGCAEVLVTEHVVEFSHQRFRKRVQAAFDGVFLSSRPTGKAWLQECGRWCGHDSCGAAFRGLELIPASNVTVSCSRTKVGVVKNCLVVSVGRF
mmetsp:Transcript_68290/g.138854  ORF Transcript_68290/g.138854 Transcript_68290/m.138854 type:complete len:236 (-) Transcript_68290:33-740(-)